MATLGSRIIQLRKAAGLSQTELASMVGVSYAQIGRYETKGAQPPAEVLNKLAEALNTSVDFLLNGNAEEKAKAALTDTELLRHFKEVDNLPEQDKNTLIRVIGAYLRDFKTRQAYQGG